MVKMKRLRLMLNMKLIGLLALVLGAVACEPLPVYPGESRQQSHRSGPEPESYARDYRDSRYFGDDEPGSRDLRMRDRDRDPRGEYDERDQGTVPGPSSYPTAERTDNPGRVISPYAPYNVIDVEGFRPGQLAKDPSNGKIFRIP